MSNGFAATAIDGQPARPSSRLQEEVRSSFDFLPATLAGNAVGLAIVGVLLGAAAPAALLAGWLAAYAVMLGARLALLRRFRRADPCTPAQWRRWQWAWNLGTLVSGALWGATAWLFYGLGNSMQQVGLIITVYTFCAVAVPVLAHQPRVFMLFTALCCVPLAARVASNGTPGSWQLAGVLLTIFATTSVLAHAYRQALHRAIDLKLQADGLALQLHAEKQAAEAARQEAEVANRAKTQFFAAASHDLRQPLHAMGLFAEALRAKTHNNDAEVVHLVNSINGSVDALESLFCELLDITRIDSGGVDVHPQPFAIEGLLRKLRLGFEPNAFEKGLALRFRGGWHVAHADPVLVERIVRNLVSNAIRYTQDGSVLVSARPRGEQLLLQVWDTGPGIDEADQQRIFEEFYQLPTNGAALPPEQHKGLGLGLAIVKRLAGLMGAPLTLRSRPDHGSVFTLQLPIGQLPATRTEAPRASTSAGLTLAGRLIVLVEDEPAVRAGLEALLHTWGATLASFDSHTTCATWAAARPATEPPPDLVITDHRLESGRTGIDAIRLLRQHFGAALPAIVVTGSSLSGHENEAQRDDFHLLIKPVAPARLRAMVAFKLGVKRN